MYNVSIWFHFVLASLAVSLAFSASAKGSPCDSIVTKYMQASEQSIHAPELCFEGQFCSAGGIPASELWTNSDDPAAVEQELVENSRWVGRITTVPIPHEGGSLIRIARRIGTASCVRDTYLHGVNGHYMVISSDSLSELSAEAAHCGNEAVEVISDRIGVLVVLADGGSLVVHRLSKSFELKRVCSRSVRTKRPSAIK